MRITVIFTILFVYSCCAGSLAQGNTNQPIKKIPTQPNIFSGKITDAKTGAAIEAATVYITDIRSGTSSDASGNFIIKNIPQGRHLVEVSHIGYSSIIENIEFNNNVVKDFALSASIIENNAVIVTGVSGATQKQKVPFSVSVLRRQDIFQNTSSNIIEALTKTGGVSTLATGPAISKPVIRGLSYNRVLTINDGVRQEGQQWGDEHGIEVDEASVNKVEVLKGPASLIYGSDAMAGVVNIITNVPVPANSLKLNVGSNFQSNNRLWALNTNIGANKNGFNWNLYTSNKWAADYENKYDGRVYNSKFNEQNAGGYAGYNASWGYSHLLVSHFNLKAGLVEGERDADGFFIKPLPGGGDAPATNVDFNNTTPQIPYQHIRHFKIATDNNIRLNKSRLTFNIGYQRNQREEFGNVDDLNERDLYFDLKTVTYTAQFHLPENKGWKTSVGINGMQQNNTNKGVEQLIPDYSLFDFGIYTFLQKTMKNISFSGGLRFDGRSLEASNLLDGTSIKGDAFKKTFSNASGSIGIAAQVNKRLNLKFNFARGFRAPSIPELASNGAHEGTTRYEYGTSNLKSETSIQLDGGIDFNTEHLSINLSAFYNSFNNFIFYRKLEAAGGGDSIVDNNGDLLSAFKFDQRKTALTGVEAVIDIHPHPLDWLHILNTFSVVSGRLKEPVEGSKFLPFVPAPRLLTEFRGNFNKLGQAVQNIYLKFEMDKTFIQNNVFTAFNTETRTPGYTLLNAGFGADIVTRKKQTLFSFSFSAINLANKAYQNHLSRLKYAPENMATGRTGVFNIGRNFSIKLNIPITVNFGK